MKPSDAAMLVALLVVVILIVAWFVRGRSQGSDPFCPGPNCPGNNLGLYDHPYFYPVFEGRAAVQWDGDRRCTANCQQSPCVVWCR